MRKSAPIQLFLLLSVFSAALSIAGEKPSMASYAESGPERKIHVAMALLDLDGIDSSVQSFTVNLFLQFRWRDPRLAHDGDFAVRAKLADIQGPRFLLINRQKTWSSLTNVVEISPDGEVVYRMRLWGDFSQIMRLQDFPLDSHIFEIPVIAFGYAGKPITLLQDPTERSAMAQQLSVADWRINSWDAEPARVEVVAGRLVDGFVFSFHASRKSEHYFIKFIIPLFLIVAMSWVVFWIDPSEGSSQLGVAVTAVLTLIAYHIALTNKLPDISYLTRMDLFLFGSTLLVFSSLIEVVITSRLASSQRLALSRSIDIVCRILFPLVYLLIAYLALVSKTGASW